MIVRHGHILDEDFPDNAHTRLPDALINRERVKLCHQVTADIPVAPASVMFLGRQVLNTDAAPFFRQCIGRSQLEFIGPHAVEAALDQVAQEQCLDQGHEGGRGNMEARILFHAVEAGGNHGDLFHAGLFQGSADKRHIIARPAASAGLRHDQCQMVDVIPPGKNGFHHLAHHNDRRIAGVIVDKAQSHVHR